MICQPWGRIQWYTDMICRWEQVVITFLAAAVVGGEAQKLRSQRKATRYFPCKYELYTMAHDKYIYIYIYKQRNSVASFAFREKTLMCSNVGAILRPFRLLGVYCFLPWQPGAPRSAAVTSRRVTSRRHRPHFEFSQVEIWWVWNDLNFESGRETPNLKPKNILSRWN